MYNYLCINISAVAETGSQRRFCICIYIYIHMFVCVYVHKYFACFCVIITARRDELGGDAAARHV